MCRKFLITISASALGMALSSSVMAAGNLLTNGGFEDFTGVFTPNSAINTTSSTWNKWLVWERFQSVDNTSLIDPTVTPSPFPSGWSGSNFAQHNQAFTGDSGDQTDQIKQGIDGNSIVPNVPVNISFKYINTEGGRDVVLNVYGINSGQSWSEFASWPCTGCTSLYTATITTPYDPNQGWNTFVGSFTPTASYAVVAVGITLGGNPGYARGVDDVVLSQNRDPDCSDALPSIAQLWSPDHSFVPIDVLGVTDPDDDAVTITVDSIFQDEPVQDHGSGSTSPDGQGVGTATAEVRAERSGGGDGRVYHIGFTADDGNGGTCEGAVQVSVPKSQGKNGTAVDQGALYDSTQP